jgi:hypothetical protein
MSRSIVDAAPFGQYAPRGLCALALRATRAWPRLIIMEFTLLRVAATLETHLRSLGYREILRTPENVAYALPEDWA